MISVQALTKTYGSRRAVTNLSFKVSEGSILGLVGPNGAGKTTTLRMLAGIVKPSGGRIIVHGHDIVKDAISVKRITGYVPDEPHLFESLTVWEHIAFTASLYQVPDYQNAADALLDRFDLESQRDTTAQSLSLGMRQKLSICCVYLTKPLLLLFDEPLTGLDPMGIREIAQSISEFAASGSTVIISSHLLDLVENLCTDILLLNEGQKILGGPLEEVLNSVHKEEGSAANTLETIFFKTLTQHEDTE